MLFLHLVLFHKNRFLEVQFLCQIVKIFWWFSHSAKLLPKRALPIYNATSNVKRYFFLVHLPTQGLFWKISLIWLYKKDTSYDHIWLLVRTNVLMSACSPWTVSSCPLTLCLLEFGIFLIMLYNFFMYHLYVNDLNVIW